MTEKIKQSILPIDGYRVTALGKYLHLGEMCVFPKGSLIFPPEAVRDRMAYVVSGEVKNILVRDDGKELLFYIAEPGHIIGNLFLFDANPMRSIATEETTICMFNKEALTKVFENDIEIVFEFFKNYMSKVNYFKTKLYITGSTSSTVKIYRLLEMLCFQEEPDANGAYHVDLSVSQKVIAEMLDVHQVTVSKVLNYLKENGIITKKGKKIVVHDLEGIKKLIELEEKM